MLKGVWSGSQDTSEYVLNEGENENDGGDRLNLRTMHVAR